MLDILNDTGTVEQTDENFKQSAWSSARISRRMDSEMAAWLRIHLREVFEVSASWAELTAKLHKLGFYLQPANSRLWLSDCHSQVKVCTCSFLGFPSTQLEDRFGAQLQTATD